MRRGFTMIEGVLSTIVVGVMMVAAVRVVTLARVIQFRNANRAQGSFLAQSLLSEILAKAYEDPTSPVFGVESGESVATRDGLDDVDDYQGWIEKPPKEANGPTMSSMGQWGREVRVERVDPANVAGPDALLETGAKRITIRVTFRDVPVFSVVAVRTRAR